MRMIHYLILGLPAVLSACASNPAHCDGRLQPVNSQAAGPPPVSAPATPATPAAVAKPAASAMPAATAAPAGAGHALPRSSP
jgi:hypothetical protein